MYGAGREGVCRYWGGWSIVIASRIPPVSWTRHDLKGSGEADIGWCHEPGMTLKAPGEVQHDGDDGVADIHFAFPPVSWARHDLKGSGERVYRSRADEELTEQMLARVYRSRVDDECIVVVSASHPHPSSRPASPLPWPLLPRVFSRIVRVR